MTVTPCAWHISPKDSDRISYFEYYERCEQAHRLGERQRQCPGCSRWFFRWQTTAARQKETETIDTCLPIPGGGWPTGHFVRGAR